uniref:Uncharacterized protein n=1 Tax=Oryza nivara TaxID=4536 RepID=A0A0E0G8G9_ORYNI
MGKVLKHRGGQGGVAPLARKEGELPPFPTINLFSRGTKHRCSSLCPPSIDRHRSISCGKRSISCGNLWGRSARASNSGERRRRRKKKMSCCGGAEEDSYGPPANQAAPPPNVNAPGASPHSSSPAAAASYIPLLLC